MAKKSFTVLLPRCDVDVGADTMAAVFNNATDPAKSVHICEIRLVPQARNSDNTNIAGNQGIMSLDRISAVSGGTEVAPVKHDTAAGNLPSQVKLYEHPDSVTITNTIRRFGDCVSSYTITKAISFQAMMRAPNVVDANDHSGRTCESHNVWHVDGDTNTEPLVLREGEGFCLTRRAFGLPQAMHFGVIIRVVSTSRTYKYLEGDIGTSWEIGRACIALINGSGSGVVLQVMIVSLPDLGEENIPTYRIVRVAKGINDIAWQGHSADVVAHDTNNSLSDVTALRGVAQLLPLAGIHGATVNYWDYSGVPISVAAQLKFDAFRVFSGAGMYITETSAISLNPDMLSRSEYEIFPGDRRGAIGMTEIILRPQQGIAVMGGGGNRIETSELAYLDLEICGYLEEPDGGSPDYPIENNVRNGITYGSGVYTGNVRLPAITNVRNGIDYGANGTEYEGNVVLPAIADVKLGVDYGAAGTEYEGTYDPGGGGGGGGHSILGG